jgi:hypothetical protein
LLSIGPRQQLIDIAVGLSDSGLAFGKDWANAAGFLNPKNREQDQWADETLDEDRCSNAPKTRRASEISESLLSCN